MPDNAIAAEVNPNAGFDRLNAVIGLKGGLLGLEAKRQALAGQAAEVQQKQLDTQASQGASDYFGSHPMRDYHDESDGTLGVNAFTVDHPDFQKLPGNVQQRVLGLAMGIKSKQLENAQAFQNLTASENSFAQSQLGAVASTDDAQRLEASIKAGKPDLDAYAKVKAAAAATMDRLENSGSQGLANVSKTYRRTASAGPADIVPAFRAINATAASAAERFPRMGMGAAQQPFVIQPTTGAVSGATGVNYGPGGVTPSAPAVAAATTSGTGQATVDNQRFSDVTGAATKAQTGIALADQVADLAKQVRTGQLTKEWSDKLTVLQQDDPKITARQMLSKYAAQLKTTAESGAATDSERAQIDAGMPSPESMNPGAVQDAAHYLHGYFRMNQIRGQNATSHVARSGSTAGLTQKDTEFMQSQDPFVHSFKDMTNDQKQEFLLRRYGAGGSKDPQGFADFERRVKGQK